MESYSFLDVSLLISGVEITGYAEGDDVIQPARLEDSASHVIGADGKMAIALNANRSGTITFRLLQTSDSNAYLSGLVNTIEAGVFVPVTAQMTDVKTGDLASGTQGYITKPADMPRGSGINTQEWVVVLENLYMLNGS